MEAPGPLRRIAVHILQAPGIGLIAANFGGDQGVVVEAQVLGQPVVEFRRIIDGLGFSVGIRGQFLGGDIRAVGVGGKIRISGAERKRGGGARPAGVFPLGLGGQVHLRSGALAQPGAEVPGPGPRHPDHWLLGLEQRIALDAELIALLGFPAAVVGRIEAPVLGVGNLGGAHPESLGDGHRGRGLFVGIGTPQGHAARRDPGEGQVEAVPQVHVARLESGGRSGDPGGGRDDRRSGRSHRGLGSRTRRRRGAGYRRHRAVDLVVVHLGVGAAQFRPAFLRLLGGFGADDGGPVAVERGVEVNPGGDPAQVLGAQVHAVVALAQKLDQFGGVGVVVHRGQHGDVAFDAGMADEAVEIRVADGELARQALVLGPRHFGIPAHQGLTPKIWKCLARSSGGAVVAADAILVEDRLDLPGEAETPGFSIPGFEVGGGLASGQGGPGRWGPVGWFMATNAGHHLAGHADEPRAHDLESLAILVEGLDRHRGVRRNGEQRRAVRFDGHGTQNPSHIPRTIHADGTVEPAETPIAIDVGEHPQGFHLALGDPCQAGSGVDVR